MQSPNSCGTSCCQWTWDFSIATCIGRSIVNFSFYTFKQHGICSNTTLIVRWIFHHSPNIYVLNLTRINRHHNWFNSNPMHACGVPSRHRSVSYKAGLFYSRRVNCLSELNIFQITFAWNLSLRNFRLGTFVWELSLGHVRLGIVAWEPSLGNFRLGWWASLGNFSLGNRLRDIGGTLGTCHRCLVFKILNKEKMFGVSRWGYCNTDCVFYT